MFVSLQCNNKIKIMRTLTGRYYFKQTFFGLILMVEHYKKEKMPDSEIIDIIDKKIYSKAKPYEVNYLNLNGK